MQKMLPSAEHSEADSIAKEAKKASDKSCHPGEPVLPRLSKDQNENINIKRRKIEMNKNKAKNATPETQNFHSWVKKIANAKTYDSKLHGNYKQLHMKKRPV